MRRREPQRDGLVRAAGDSRLRARPGRRPPHQHAPAAAEWRLRRAVAGRGRGRRREGARADRRERATVEGNRHGDRRRPDAIAGTDVEPIYGRTYLPRKFKAAVAVAGDNSVDLFTNDLGFVPIFDGERARGLERLRRRRARANAPQARDVPAARGRARLRRRRRSAADRRGRRDRPARQRRPHQPASRAAQVPDPRPWHRVVPRAGRAASPAWRSSRRETVEWTRGDDLLGWHEQGDGRWFLGLRVDERPGGRPRRRARSGARRCGRSRPSSGCRCASRRTRTSTCLDVSPAQRFRVDEILAANAIESGADLRGLRRLSMACPALPTCGLAVTEAERALPGILDTLQATFDEVGVSDAVPTVRMTGCPNGCARPYVAEIGLVGDAVDRYQVWLGGDAAGTRLATARCRPRPQGPAARAPRAAADPLPGRASRRRGVRRLPRSRPSRTSSCPRRAPRPIRHVPCDRGGRARPPPRRSHERAARERPSRLRSVSTASPLPVDAERLDAKGVLQPRARRHRPGADRALDRARARGDRDPRPAARAHSQSARLHARHRAAARGDARAHRSRARALRHLGRGDLPGRRPGGADDPRSRRQPLLPLGRRPAAVLRGAQGSATPAGAARPRWLDHRRPSRPDRQRGPRRRRSASTSSTA